MFEIIMNSVTNNMLEIVLTVISCIVSYLVIPTIRDTIIPWLKQKHIYHLIKIFVQAVEKMAESGAIEKTDKKQMVVDLLNKNGIEITASIDAAIESAVKELDLINNAIKEEFLKEE